MSKGREKAVLSNSLKTLEKELYRSNSLLEEVNKINDSLKSIETQSDLLEKLTESDPNLNAVFKDHLKDKKVLDKFKELESNLFTLKKTISGFEEQNFRTDLFLENYRTSNEYYFSDEKNAVQFIEGVCSMFNSKELFFGPKIIGVVDLNKVSKDLALSKASPNYLKVSKGSLLKLLGYLKENAPVLEYVVDCSEFRLSYIDIKKITIKSNPLKIKKIDQLARVYKGDPGK